MSDNAIEKFRLMQDFNKTYINLKDGESVRVTKLKRMEYPVTDKFGKQVLRMYCEVDCTDPMTGEVVSKEKTFDRGTQSWSDEISEAGLTIGSAFTMTRHGAKGDKNTKYVLSEVVNPAGGKEHKDAITDPNHPAMAAVAGAPAPATPAKDPASAPIPKDNAPSK